MARPILSGYTSVQRRRFLVLAVLRPMLTVAVLVLLYYVLPVDRQLDVWTLVLLVGGLCLVVAVVVWQVMVIVRSRHPLLQGVQALAIVVPLFLLVFADVYYLLSLGRPGSFSEGLTRTDALYFVVTVFATVGFGDITPVTTTARVLVTFQMVGDLLVLGVVLKVIVNAVQQGRQHPHPPE
ncbi:MAG TPA: potassium channel family protein [Amycolatopsis sp.]|uniref:potassium channel family protein n=1 Tax=Amycolatopsis sp. TaxID=37632 RepID=UPI002B48B784|nr:potassium channel family protein [Amycolatopsis sp.]HKS49617.1 potassium channel family protein [Amycolatopsis sp.]